MTKATRYAHPARFAALAVGSLAIAGAAAADEPRAQGVGVYAGVELALETVIAGALVDGVDFLVQDHRPVLSLVAGLRWRTSSGLVLGAEGAIGISDQSLRLVDPGRALAIDYENAFQWRYGGTVGWALGPDRRSPLFAYLKETTRTFDVEGRGPRGSFQQRDEQGLLGYGLGFEQRLAGPVTLSARLGSARADFGDRETATDVDEPLEAALGAQLQF